MSSTPRKLKSVTAAAMIGTDRSSTSGTPQMLLTQAAYLGARARAGFKPPRVKARLSPCPCDPLPGATPAQAATLLRLLGDRDAGLLNEWAELAHAKGLRVPDSAVAMVLDWWSRQPKRAEVVYAVLGQRGEWLASLNPAWRRPVASNDIPDGADDLWLTGTVAERTALLLSIRRVDPERAREMVKSTWKASNADERRRFVEVLAETCSMDDEPFLEGALDDKSIAVRRAAAALLSKLPHSRFKARMNQRARSIVLVERIQNAGSDSIKVVLSPPEAYDSEWKRDAIEELANSGVGKRADWLRQILSAADVSVWTEITRLDPHGVMDSIAGDDFFVDALVALVESSRTHPDTQWRQAIIRKMMQRNILNLDLMACLWNNLPQSSSEALVLEAAAYECVSLLDCWLILASTPHRWSAEFSLNALSLIATRQSKKDESWLLCDTLQRAGRLVSPHATEQFEHAVRSLLLQEPSLNIKKSIDLVRLRADMHKEFAS